MLVLITVKVLRSLNAVPVLYTREKQKHMGKLAFLFLISSEDYCYATIGPSHGNRHTAVVLHMAEFSLFCFFCHVIL